MNSKKFNYNVEYMPNVHVYRYSRRGACLIISFGELQYITPELIDQRLTEIEHLNQLKTQLGQSTENHYE